jgi:hypothetical protein
MNIATPMRRWMTQNPARLRCTERGVAARKRLRDQHASLELSTLQRSAYASEDDTSAKRVVPVVGSTLGTAFPTNWKALLDPGLEHISFPFVISLGMDASVAPHAAHERLISRHPPGKCFRVRRTALDRRRVNPAGRAVIAPFHDDAAGALL